MQKISNVQNYNKEKNLNEDYSTKNQSIKDTNATLSHLKPDDIYKIREELKKKIRNSLIDTYEKLVNIIDKKLQIDYSNEDRKDMTLEKKYEKLLKELCPENKKNMHNFEEIINNKTRNIKLNNNNNYNSDNLIEENNNEEIKEESQQSIIIRKPNVFKGINHLKKKISIKREKNKTLDYNYVLTNGEDEKKSTIKQSYNPNINMNSIELTNSDNNIFQSNNSNQNKQNFLRCSSKFHIYKKYNKTKYVRRDKKLNKILNMFSNQDSNSFERKIDIKSTNLNKNIFSFCKKDIGNNTLSAQKSSENIEFFPNENIINNSKKRKYIYKNTSGPFIPKNKSFNIEKIKINSNINKIPKFFTLNAFEKFNKINIESEKKIFCNSNGKKIKKIPRKLKQSTTEINIINSLYSSNMLKNASSDKNLKKINNLIIGNNKIFSNYNTLVNPCIAKKQFKRTSNKIKLKVKSPMNDNKTVNCDKTVKTTIKILQNDNKKNIKINPFKISLLKFGERKKNSNFRNKITNSTLSNEKNQKVICIRYEKNIRNESNNSKVFKNNDETNNNFTMLGKNLRISNYINTHNNSTVDNNKVSIRVKKNTNNNNLNSEKNVNKKMKNFNTINTNKSILIKNKIIKGKIE